MQNAQGESTKGNLFTRDDTFFGVCQGLGEDLGINPLYLRLAFPLLLFLYPMQAVVGYAAAGLLVLTVRMIVREPRAPKPVQAEAAEPAVQEEQAPEAMPLAA